MSRQGTGDEMIRVDLGPIGELVIADDGCTDVDVHAYVDDGSGTTHSLGHQLCDMLRHGSLTDDELIEEFERLKANQAETSPLPDGYEPSYHQGHFSCDDCHRTFPGKYRGPDNEEVCPDCRGDA